MIYFEKEKTNEDYIALLDIVSSIDYLSAMLRQAITNNDGKYRIDALADNIEKEAVKIRTELFKIKREIWDEKESKIHKRYYLQSSSLLTSIEYTAADLKTFGSMLHDNWLKESGLVQIEEIVLDKLVSKSNYLSTCLSKAKRLNNKIEKHLEKEK